MNLYAASLRVCFLLFENMRGHLKFQLEVCKHYTNISFKSFYIFYRALFLIEKIGLILCEISNHFCVL